jgi:hypothetical protein
MNLNTASAVKTDVVLKRLQVVERWFDPENRIPYVLVRVPLKDIGIFYSSFTILRLHFGGTKS